MEQADAICYGTLALRSPETHDTIIELLKHTKPGAMKFFDINLRGDHYSKELIEELLKAATVFKINDEELLLLRDMFDIRGTSGEDASRWFIEEFGLDYVILTAGSATPPSSPQGEVSTLDTPHVEVNDTVGAGDSFSGTFTARILLGDTLAEAHRKAVNTAATSAPRPVPGRSTRPRCPTTWLEIRQVIHPSPYPPFVRLHESTDRNR